MTEEITRNYARKERLWQVNDCDYIDIDCIQAIHVDGENKQLSVLYFGTPILVTKTWVARSIVEKWCEKTQAINICKELNI